MLCDFLLTKELLNKASCSKLTKIMNDLKPPEISYVTDLLLNISYYLIALALMHAPLTSFLGKFSRRIVNMFLQRYHYDIDIKYRTSLHGRNIIKF